jgi:hypothetical protein
MMATVAALRPRPERPRDLSISDLSWAAERRLFAHRLIVRTPPTTTSRENEKPDHGK